MAPFEDASEVSCPIAVGEKSKKKKETKQTNTRHNVRAVSLVVLIEVVINNGSPCG
jgi:hypothetical protein